ncbi:MAG: hypothetical protein N2513_04100 [Deltaproteobacteria bacterium]|nr:hypothetical protein [Deltaproteobacteria bacterium]
MESLLGLALKGSGVEILRRLGGEKRQRIMEAMAYVENNLDWIENIPMVQGYGSGPIEKMVDIAVSRRFKRRDELV